jgi:hypothetical protein
LRFEGEDLGVLDRRRKSVARSLQRTRAFTPHLATSLNSLAATLSALGCQEEAVEATEEAAALRR